MTAAGQAHQHAKEAPERLYVITRGRTQPPPGGRFELFTLVVAETPAPAPSGIQAEHEQVLRLCRQPQSVLELSGHLSLPVGVVKIILDDLFTQGRITAHAPHTRPSAHQPDIDILKAVLHGLANL